MAKESKGELVVIEQRFDYSPLEAKSAETVQAPAERIREKVKRTVVDIIEVGEELLSVKEALPDGSELHGGRRALRQNRNDFGFADRAHGRLPPCGPVRPR